MNANICFSPEEDAVILKEVKKNGANLETWKRIASLLHRLKHCTISARYSVLCSQYSAGHWTSEEDEVFLEHFFAGKTDSTAQDIRDISIQDLKNVEEKHDRYINIINHVHVYLKLIAWLKRDT
jgi:hypothetical protein